MYEFLPGDARLEPMLRSEISEVLKLAQRISDTLDDFLVICTRLELTSRRTQSSTEAYEVERLGAIGNS